MVVVVVVASVVVVVVVAGSVVGSPVMLSGGGTSASATIESAGANARFAADRNSPAQASADEADHTPGARTQTDDGRDRALPPPRNEVTSSRYAASAATRREPATTRDRAARASGGRPVGREIASPMPRARLSMPS